MITDTINKCKEFFKVDCTINQIQLKDYRQIKTRAKGIYILHTTDRTIYVGKGFIRSRQPKHWDKAINELNNTKDTLGWAWLRENFDCTNPGEWYLTYLELNTRSEQSAMEGALIHFLQPLANDETYG
jgi:hypothetical protein